MVERYGVGMSPCMKISLYIPGIGEEPALCVRDTLAGLSQITGGASAQQITGAWIMGDYRLVTEPVTQVYTFAESALVEECIALVASLALTVKKRLGQEAVLYTEEPMGAVAFV